MNLIDYTVRLMKCGATTRLVLTLLGGLLLPVEWARSENLPFDWHPTPGFYLSSPGDNEFVRFSATVYDRKVTLLRWFEDGHEFRAYSNVDFNYLSGPGSISLGGVTLHFTMGIGNESAALEEDTLGGAGYTRLPNFSNFPADRSRYFIIGDQPQPGSRMVSVMDAFHRYFDAHRNELIAAYERRQRDWLERLAYVKANPPLPASAPLSAWMKESQDYVTRIHAAKLEGRAD
jgi:hypothetical protein